MADLMPDYNLEQLKIQTQIAQLQFNLARARQEIMEFQSRAKQSKINIEATNLAIADCKKRLAGLIKEHGAATFDEED